MAFLKDPESVLDYRFDWSAWLDEGETIVDHTIDSNDGITVVSSSMTGTAVTVWLSGGTARQEYLIACLVTTSAGRTDERMMRIKVQHR